MGVSDDDGLVPLGTVTSFTGTFDSVASKEVVDLLTGKGPVTLFGRDVKEGEEIKWGDDLAAEMTAARANVEHVRAEYEILKEDSSRKYSEWSAADRKSRLKSKELEEAEEHMDKLLVHIHEKWGKKEK